MNQDVRHNCRACLKLLKKTHTDRQKKKDKPLDSNPLQEPAALLFSRIARHQPGPVYI